jgi:ParB family transcriptional regulator, chromosome partitioning protein
MVDFAVSPKSDKPPGAIGELAAAIQADGGEALAAFEDPIGGHWHIFALLPLSLVEGTPYQRDLSPAHLKRMVEVMKKLDRYTEPIVAVRADGRYWTPNGNHRRAAAAKVGAKSIPAIVVPEPEVAFQILALNTEKAHNLRDKALEVIRMYRARLEEQPRRAEKEFAFEFERAHFITLGLLYEKKPKFSGGAYAPILSRVDNFLAQPLKEAIGEREERAEQVERADELVTTGASVPQELHHRPVESADASPQDHPHLQHSAEQPHQSAVRIRPRQDSLRSNPRSRANRRGHRDRIGKRRISDPHPDKGIRCVTLRAVQIFL